MSEPIKVAVRSVAEAIDRLRYRIDQLNNSILETNRLIVAMQGALVAKIGDLQSTILDLERQKLHAKAKTLNDLLLHVSNNALDVNNRFEAEKEKMRQEYSEAINRIVNHLEEEIRVNVEELHAVLKQYKTILSKYIEPALSLAEKLESAYSHIYNKRLQRLQETRKRIVRNFDEFLESREDLVQRIESMETTGITVERDTVIYVPFWLIGILEKDKEEIVALPPLERRFSGEHASRMEPYVDHLKPPVELSLEELARSIADAPNVEVARRNSTCLDVATKEFQEFLLKLQLEDLVDESFIDAMDKFPEVCANVQ